MLFGGGHLEVCRAIWVTIKCGCIHNIITPHACARGKVIGCIVVVVSTKIAISRDIGVYATRNHEE